MWGKQEGEGDPGLLCTGSPSGPPRACGRLQIVSCVVSSHASFYSYLGDTALWECPDQELAGPNMVDL